MPSGLKIALPFAFNDPGNVLPKLPLDAILRRGSVFLADMNHPNNPTAIVGAPVNNMAIPNIAWNEAALIGGGGVAADWGARIGHSLVAADAILERSGKGGMHVLMSQTTDVSHGFFVGASSDNTKLTQYVFNNPTHRFGVWLWENTTRLPKTATVEPLVSKIWSASGGSDRNLVQMDRISNKAQSLSASMSAPLPTPLGHVRRGIAGTGFAFANPTSAADTRAYLWMTGIIGGVGSGLHASRAAIFYRAYVEDLTVSGRTFEQVDAVDAALWARETAVGGRYYGDTFTDPATFA